MADKLDIRGSTHYPKMDLSTKAVERLIESVWCGTDSRAETYLTMMELLRDRDRLAAEVARLSTLLCPT